MQPAQMTPHLVLEMDSARQQPAWRGEMVRGGSFAMCESLASRMAINSLVSETTAPSCGMGSIDRLSLGAPRELLLQMPSLGRYDL